MLIDVHINQKGKTAIVTGGTSGIGKAISKKFAAQGANVHILELKKEEGKRVVAEIIKDGGKAKSYVCDVSRQEQVRDVVTLISEGGTTDILVNNAGIAHVGNVEITTEEDLNRIYQVNIKGVYNCVHAVIPFMKKDGGCIIDMASIASVVRLADRFAYSMSKGAALTMTYSIAKDDTFAPLGPFLVTKDEIPNPHNLDSG